MRMVIVDSIPSVYWHFVFQESTAVDEQKLDSLCGAGKRGEGIPKQQGGHP